MQTKAKQSSQENLQYLQNLFITGSVAKIASVEKLRDQAKARNLNQRRESGEFKININRADTVFRSDTLKD